MSCADRRQCKPGSIMLQCRYCSIACILKLQTHVTFLSNNRSNLTGSAQCGSKGGNRQGRGPRLLLPTLTVMACTKLLDEIHDRHDFRSILGFPSRLQPHDIASRCMIVPKSQTWSMFRLLSENAANVLGYLYYEWALQEHYRGGHLNF